MPEKIWIVYLEGKELEGMAFANEAEANQCAEFIAEICPNDGNAICCDAVPLWQRGETSVCEASE